jgi:hypothetical protein
VLQICNLLINVKNFENTLKEEEEDVITLCDESEIDLQLLQWVNA